MASTLFTRLFGFEPLFQNPFPGLRDFIEGIGSKIKLPSDVSILSRDTENALGSARDFKGFALEPANDDDIGAIRETVYEPEMNTQAKPAREASHSVSLGDLTLADDATSYTANGITIETVSGTLTDTGDILDHGDQLIATGLGIRTQTGNRTEKVFGEHERFTISDDYDNVTEYRITVGDIGENNTMGDDGIEALVTYTNGTTEVLEFQFTQDNVKKGLFTFSITGIDDLTIDQVELYSSNAGKYGNASFVLNEVEVVERLPLPTIKISGSYAEVDETGLRGNDSVTARGTEIVVETSTDLDTRLQFTDTFIFSGSVGQKLKSGGYEVSYETDGETGVLYATNKAGEQFEILTTSFDGNTPVAVLTGTLDHADGLDPNDFINTKFGVEAVGVDCPDIKSPEALVKVKIFDDTLNMRNDKAVLEQGQTEVVIDITANDRDSADGETVYIKVDGQNIPKDGLTVEGEYGYLTIYRDGTETKYELKDDLPLGQKFTDKFEITGRDGDKDLDTSIVTVKSQTPDPFIKITGSKTEVDETGLRNAKSVTGEGTDIAVTSNIETRLQFTNTFDFGGSVGQKLKSNGLTVKYETDGETGVLYAENKAGEQFEILTTSFDGNTPVAVLTGTLDHADGLDPNDFINTKFGVQAVGVDYPDVTSNETLFRVSVYNDGLNMRNDKIVMEEGQTKATIDISANDTHSVDGDSTTYIKVDGQNISKNGTTVEGKYGFLTINRDGKVTEYQLKDGLPAGKKFKDTFDITGRDGDKDLDTSTLTITAQTAPLPDNEFYGDRMTVWGYALDNSLNVFRNDTGPDGGDLLFNPKISSVEINGRTYDLDGKKKISIDLGHTEITVNKNGQIDTLATRANAQNAFVMTVNTVDSNGTQASQNVTVTQLSYVDNRSGGVTIHGTDITDTVSLTNDPDTIYAGGGADVVIGSATYTTAHGDAGDTIHGENGSDILVSAGGNDYVDGGNGSDFIVGGDGNDTLDGGNGDDIIGYDPSTLPDTKSFVGFFGSDDPEDGVSPIRLTDSFYFNNGGADKISGGNGDDIAFGGAGKDKLDGGNGDDTLYGGKGDDKLDGGNGDDKLDGGKGDDTLDGGKGQDEIAGADGNNVLFGGEGEDVFIFKPNADGKNVIKDYESDLDVVMIQGDRDTDLRIEFVEYARGDTTIGLNNDGEIVLQDTRPEDIRVMGADYDHFIFG